MPIIMISSAAHSAGEELAQSLVKKTGWPSLSRTELVEKARERGIKLGRLETSIIKSPVAPEKLAKEKNLYLAFITTILCEKGEGGNLVYQGRAGHLLLPGVTHRLRVGLMTPDEMRIEKAMKDLRVPREKAEIYLDQLDKDFDKWVRYVHHADRLDPSQYDLFVNLYNVSLPNLSATLCGMAELPDFQPTPVSMRLMANLDLTARAKVHLTTHELTRNLDLGVRAVDGVVTVTYMPRQEGAAEAISKVLRGLEGCKETRCTMAETNILWVQESFSPDSENFEEIVQLSRRWGAAVELLQMAPATQQIQAFPEERQEVESDLVQRAVRETYTGGVEDDSLESEAEDNGLTQTTEALVSMGRSAGGETIYGTKDEIIEKIRGESNCSLVVLGNLFLDKGHEARMRLMRELSLAIREKLKAPVITVDEMKSRFLFGKKQAIKLLAFAALVACIYALVFSFQDPIMNFLGGEIHEKWKWVASVGMALFVPFVAYCYSTVTGLLLKLIGID
jgi:hypothetical protein